MFAHWQMKGKRPDDNVPFVSSEFFNELTQQWRKEAEVTDVHLSACPSLQLCCDALYTNRETLLLHPSPSNTIHPRSSLPYATPTPV
jgi:hypothetical protein